MKAKTIAMPTRLRKLPMPNLRQWLLVVLLLTVTAFRTIPSLGSLYTAAVYPAVIRVLATVSGIVPFAIGDVFVAASVAWVVGYPLWAIRAGRKVRTIAMRVGEYLLWVYVWFYAAWGLNYSQPNIYRRLHLSPAEADTLSFAAFAKAYADSLNATYSPLCGPAADSSVQALTRRAVYDGYARLHRMGINRPFSRRVHAKTMVFSPLASMAGVTGSMAPFFGEFTVNADVLTHAYPATCAHEYAHLLGIANEGEANFYSYIVCTSSAEKAVRFSGYYQLFFHVLHNVRALLGEAQCAAFLKRVRPEVTALAQADQRYWQSRRSPIVDKVQNAVYDLYLRGNHVEGGTRSYSGVIAIIMAWQAAGKSPADGGAGR